MSMIRKKLSEILRQKTELSSKECAQFVDQVFETISEVLQKGEAVKISGFGNFIVCQKYARKGRNP